MKGWWRRVRAALGMGAIWAGGGGFIGGMIELISNVFPSLPLGFVDMWIQTLAIPGFLGGVIFSGVLGVAARRKRFDELSLPLMAGLGAIGGVVLGVLVTALGVDPLIIAPATALSALGASLTLTFARMAERQDRLGAGADQSERGLRARPLLDSASREGTGPESR